MSDWRKELRTAPIMDNRSCITKTIIMVKLTYLSSLDRLLLNLTEFLANLVSLPEYTHTPTIQRVFRRKLPFGMNWAIVKGRVSPSMVMFPLKVCMNWLGPS